MILVSFPCPQLCHAAMGFVTNLSMDDMAVMVYGRYLEGLVL